jgi:hypothetical protein
MKSILLNLASIGLIAVNGGAIFLAADSEARPVDFSWPVFVSFLLGIIVLCANALPTRSSDFKSGDRKA